MLVELAAERDGEVGGGAGRAAAGEHVFPVLKGAASAFAYVHVLEAGLHTVVGEAERIGQTSSQRDVTVHLKKWSHCEL